MPHEVLQIPALKLRHFADPRALPAAPPLPSSPIPCAEVAAEERAGDGIDATRSLVSSCSGRIGHILFVLTAQMFSNEATTAERLLRAAGDFPRISLLGHEPLAKPARELLARLGLEAKCEIILAPPEAELWGWAQDRFLVCETGSGGDPVIVQSGTVRAGDTARYAARAQGIAGRAAITLPVEGGNILAGAGQCFVGADVNDRMPSRVRAAGPLAAPSPAERDGNLRRRVAAELECRRRIHVVGGRTAIARRGPARFEISPGNLTWRQDVDRALSWDGTRQPVFHIDMFMTLAGRAPDGRSRVLLGDPVWASRLTGVPLPAGFPALAFAEVAQALEEAGCEVIRNPLPFIYFDDPAARLREWCYASANNCWVEQLGDGSGRVWLPEYGFGAWPELRATDEANAAIWRQMGFEVIGAGDFLPLADQLGSLNCVSKVLGRCAA